MNRSPDIPPEILEVISNGAEWIDQQEKHLGEYIGNLITGGFSGVVAGLIVYFSSTIIQDAITPWEITKVSLFSILFLLAFMLGLLLLWHIISRQQHNQHIREINKELKRIQEQKLKQSP